MVTIVTSKQHISFIDCRKALEEVKHDLAERQYRWQQVENMCSFSIISNPGIKALIQSTGHTDLYRYCHGGKYALTLISKSPDFRLTDISGCDNCVVLLIKRPHRI